MAKVVAKKWKSEDGRVSKEGVESLLKRFKKKVANEGILQDMKSHEFYVSEGQKRRAARDAAIRRNKRNLAKQALKEKLRERSAFKRVKEATK